MDLTRATWNNDAVRVAVQSGDPGAIIRAVRRANDLTLVEVAQRCGYSASTLSRLERGKQSLRDIGVLRSLAEALRIPSTLLGLADTPPRSVQACRPAAMVGVILSSDEEADPMRRRTLLAGLTSLAGTAVVRPSSLPASAVVADPIRALEQALLAPPSDGSPADVLSLRTQLAHARSVFQQGRYADVAARLLRLLPTAHATRHEARSGDDIAHAEAQMAELHTLTAELMVKIGNDPLAWTTADRAMQSAHATDDVLSQATASRTWAIVLRRANRADAAQRLIIDTAEALQSDLHRGPDYLSVYGSLLSTAAYTAAVDGDRDTARSLIDEAVAAADRLGVDANHRFTAFGPTGVDVYQVSIARVLGDSGTAIDLGRRVNTRAIPVVERRARYWSDIARSFHQWNKPEQCYRALLAAEKVSPDETRYRKPIQRITTSLLTHPMGKNLAGLRAFAQRNGVSTA